MKVWILTDEVNDYDQYGEYFQDVYSEKPSVESLMKATERDSRYCQWLLDTGGGRKNPWDEHPFNWFNLREVECK